MHNTMEQSSKKKLVYALIPLLIIILIILLIFTYYNSANLRHTVRRYIEIKPRSSEYSNMDINYATQRDKVSLKKVNTPVYGFVLMSMFDAHFAEYAADHALYNYFSLPRDEGRPAFTLIDYDINHFNYSTYSSNIYSTELYALHCGLFKRHMQVDTYSNVYNIKYPTIYYMNVNYEDVNWEYVSKYLYDNYGLTNECLLYAVEIDSDNNLVLSETITGKKYKVHISEHDTL